MVTVAGEPSLHVTVMVLKTGRRRVASYSSF